MLPVSHKPRQHRNVDFRFTRERVAFIDHSGLNLLVASTLFCEFADFIIFIMFPNVQGFYRPKYSVTGGFLIVM